MCIQRDLDKPFSAAEKCITLLHLEVCSMARPLFFIFLPYFHIHIYFLFFITLMAVQLCVIELAFQ